jgi:hypothetical protein
MRSELSDMGGIMNRKGRTVQRLVVVGVLALGLAVVVTGCGSSTKSSASTTPSTSATPTGPVVPTVQLAADGTYFAQVADKSAAVDAANTMQTELGQQLKQLGAESGSVQIVAFQYGEGTPTVPNASYALSAGDVITVSKTVTLCGVAVP